MRSSALPLWLWEFCCCLEPQADWEALGLVVGSPDDLCWWFTCEEPSLPDTLSLLHYCGS